MAAQAGLCQTWSETPKTGFLASQLILFFLSDVLCLEEMSIVFECFKAYNYNEETCAAEISAFNKCVGEAKVSRGITKSRPSTVDPEIFTRT